MTATALFLPRARAAIWGARLWPRACLLCEQGCGAEPLCAACAAVLPGADTARCPVCAAAVPARPGCLDCARLQPVLAATWAAADYRSPLAEAITALKFGRQLGLASGLGLLLARSLAAQSVRRAAADTQGEATTDAAAATPANRAGPRIDCLVPIPLSAARLAERGFNQAESIARALARHWPAADLPPAPALRCDLLARTRDTPHQSRLGGAARLDNVGAGFAAADATNLGIGLVDDVMTTGATLDAAARALLQAGAREVVAFVVARTP